MSFYSRENVPMITKAIEMPEVSRCDASVCAYNSENGCRARAITIGDGAFPGCDTFLGDRPRERDRGRGCGGLQGRWLQVQLRV